jgi:hypothetical protein
MLERVHLGEGSETVYYAADYAAARAFAQELLGRGSASAA